MFSNVKTKMPQKCNLFHLSHSSILFLKVPVFHEILVLKKDFSDSGQNLGQINKRNKEMCSVIKTC